MNLKITPEWFKERCLIDELYKEVCKKVKNITLKQKKVHSKKGIKALFKVGIISNKEKENSQYLDTVAIIHMTHDLSFYINSDLDYQTAEIEIANDTIFKT